MKHFVRILVTVLILGIVGGGVWYFFFRTNPSEVVFAEMSKSITHLEDDITLTNPSKKYSASNYQGETDGRIYKGYKGAIELFYNLNSYQVSGYTYTYTEDKKQVVLWFRNGTELPEGTPEGGTKTDSVPGYVVANENYINLKSYTNEKEDSKNSIEYKYLQYDEISMKALKYYYSLSASAKKVKRNDRNDLKDLIKDYNTKVDSVVASIRDLAKLHSSVLIVEESVGNSANQAAYKNLINTVETIGKKIEAKQIAQNLLILRLKDYVNKYVFNTSVIDYKSAAYDVYTNQFNIYLLERDETPKKNKLWSYTNVLNAIKSKIDAYEGEDGYINDNSVNFLESYTKLVNTKDKLLIKVLNLKERNEASINTNIGETYLTDVNNVLNYLFN